jgi:hypothetical protein
MPASAHLEELRVQRDRAFACLGLSAAVSLALFAAQFLGHTPELDGANQAVALHRGLLQEGEHILRENETVLRQTEGYLAELKKAAVPTRR